MSRERTQRSPGNDLKNGVPFSTAALCSLRSFAAKKLLARRRQIHSFTLLEMMITLAIFILLVAAIFGIMMAVFQSTASLQDNQNRRDQIEALNGFLKKQLGEMSATATIGTYQRGNGEGLVQNGIIFGTTNSAMVIDAKVQPNGYYALRLAAFTNVVDQDQPQDARQVLQQAVTGDDSTLAWTSLIGDLKTLDWTFLDFNATQWVELWTSPSKPNLVQFSMQPAGELQPVTMDFWLPPLVATVITTGGVGGGGAGEGAGGPPPTNRAGVPRFPPPPP
jgi:type II secretory pathway pseudopilin PulG